MAEGILARARRSRLFQILLVYLGVTWLIIQVVGELRDMLELPSWIGPVTLILLSVGLLIVLATAWVQSHPQTELRERAEEVPGSWELDLGDAVKAVRRGRMPHLTWGRALAGGALAFCVLFGIAGAYVLLRSDVAVFGPGQASAGEASDAIAVLPFTVRGGAPEEWRESMVDLLSTGLDGAAGLRTIASRTLLARWHELVKTEVDEEAALDVARRVGARYAIVGSAVAAGSDVRLSADVYEIGPNGVRSLGQAQEQGHPDSTLALVDRLGMGVLRHVLRDSREGLPRIDVASVTTSSLPALKGYLEGEAHFRRGDFAAAIGSYENAVALDSTFALAYWRLAQAHGWNENARSPRGLEASTRALQHVDRLPPREAILVRASHHLRRAEMEGVELLEQAVAKYPDDAEAWYQLGDAYYHTSNAVAGFEEMQAAFERAATLAPHVASYRIHLLDGAFNRYGDSAAVRAQLDELRRIAPESPQTSRAEISARIAFGSEAVRDSIFGFLLDSVRANPTFGPAIGTRLQHPRMLAVVIRMAGSAYERSPAPARAAIADRLATVNLWNGGRIRAALEWLRRPAIEPQLRSAHVLGAHLFGLPLPKEEVEAAGAAIDVRGPQAFTAGAFAANRQQWDRHAAAIAALEARADSLLLAGDSMQARQRRGDAELLRGYALWQRGNANEAVRVMDNARRTSELEFARWWIAMLHFQAGRWRDAEPYFRSFHRWHFDPLTAYYLGHIYEKTDRPAEAREMFAHFAESWAGADPELQPLVADANERLARLSREPSRR